MALHTTYDCFYPSLISKQLRKLSTYFHQSKSFFPNEDNIWTSQLKKRPAHLSKETIRNSTKPIKVIRSKSLTNSIKMCRKQLQHFEQNFKTNQVKLKLPLQRTKFKSNSLTLISNNKEKKKNIKYKSNIIQTNSRKCNQIHMQPFSSKLSLTNCLQLKENRYHGKKILKRKKEGKKNNSSFGSSSKRFNSHQRTYNSIGPGTYYNSQEPKRVKMQENDYIGYNNKVAFSRALANIYRQDYQKQIKCSSKLVINPIFRNELLRDDSKGIEQAANHKIIHTGPKKITIDDYNLFRKKTKSEKSSYAKIKSSQMNKENLKIQKICTSQLNLSQQTSRKIPMPQLSKLRSSQIKKSLSVFTKKSNTLRLTNFKQQDNLTPPVFQAQSAKNALQQEQENKISPMYIQQ